MVSDYTRIITYYILLRVQIILLIIYVRFGEGGGASFKLIIKKEFEIDGRLCRIVNKTAVF